MGIRSDMLDCLVIGGGPAGLLAAVYLGRYRRSVQVIDAGESRAATIPESHNYPGFFGIAGSELLRRLNAQARQYGAELMGGRVTSLRKKGNSFVARSSGSDVHARFILLATGLVDHCPPQLKVNRRSARLRWSGSVRSATAMKPWTIVW